MLRNFLITFVGGFAANMCVSDKIPPQSPFTKGAGGLAFSVYAERVFGIPSASCCFKQACCAIFSSHLLGASRQTCACPTKSPLIPPLGKGGGVGGCLYVLNLYAASTERVEVSEKHEAQSDHHLRGELRGKHAR